MKRKIVTLSIFFSLFIFQFSAEAIVSETLNAGINALSTHSEEEELANVEDFIKLLVKEGEQETVQKDFQKYIKDCREVSISHKKVFENYILPLMLLEKKIPLIDGLLTTGTMQIFMWHYNSSLDDIAKTPSQKKFNEIRSHSIDTAQSTFEQMFDAGFDFKDKNPNLLEAGLMMFDFEQLKKSYITSSTCVYAIEIILKFDTEEIDNGNIFINLTELPKIDLNSIRSVTEKLRLNSLAKSKNESTVSEIPKHNEKTSTPTPTPHSDVDNARQAFINYHKAITDKDYRKAYDTLSYNQRQAVGDFDSYVNGYTNTISSAVENLTLAGSTEDSYTFDYKLIARDRYQGKVKVQIFNGQVTMAKDNAGWFIRSAKSTKNNEYIE